MIQHGHHAPDGTRTCDCGRLPSLIESRGNGTITWHFECWPCLVATERYENTAHKGGMSSAWLDWENRELVSIAIKTAKCG